MGSQTAKIKTANVEFICITFYFVFLKRCVYGPMMFCYEQNMQLFRELRHIVSLDGILWSCYCAKYLSADQINKECFGTYGQKRFNSVLVGKPESMKPFGRYRRK